MGQGTSRDRNGSWELEAHSDHQPKPGEHCSINAMAASPDGSILATGGDDNLICLWDIANPETKCIGKLGGHRDYITTLGIVGTFVVTGSADHTIRKWSMVEVYCEYAYEGHKERIQRLLCTPDFIISSSTDHTCMLWKMDDSSQYTDRLRTPDDPEDERWIRAFRGHTGAVYAICFLPGDSVDTPAQPNGHSGDGEDGQEDSQPQQEPEQEDEDGIHPRDLLITGSADGTCRSWSLATGEHLKTFKGHRGAVLLMSIDSTGKLLYSSGSDKTVREWNIEKSTCTHVISGHTDSVSCMLLFNKLLYTGSADARARCFNTEFGDCIRTYGPHRDTVSCLRGNGGILFTGCTDSVARAFDAGTSRLLRCYSGHEAAITCMQISKKRLYTGGADGILRVWDADVPPEEISQVMEGAAKSVDDTGAGATPPEPEEAAQ